MFYYYKYAVGGLSGGGGLAEGGGFVVIPM